MKDTCVALDIWARYCPSSTVYTGSTVIMDHMLIADPKLEQENTNSTVSSKSPKEIIELNL